MNTSLMMMALSASLVAAPLTNAVHTKRDKDIVQTAIAAGSFKTLAAALGKAGLVDALRGKGPFTVFAPTDAAFRKLPRATLANLLKPENKAQLVAILKYHVVAGKVDALAALRVRQAKTLQGAKVAVRLVKGQLTVNKSKVVQTDIKASNGVIHVIDTVLLPPAPAPLSRRAAARKLVEDAIEVGVPLFNNGQEAACAAIYRLTAFSLGNLAKQELGSATRRRITTALQKAATQKPTDQAWTLRYALDQAYGELSRPRARATSGRHSARNRGLRRRTNARHKPTVHRMTRSRKL